MPFDPNLARFPGLALEALSAADIDSKLETVARLAHFAGSAALHLHGGFEPAAPDEPGRPERPLLVSPRDLARRSATGEKSHAALIHAIAHIEFNAINLALDAACRFPGLPHEFYADWLQVAAEEAKHFGLLRAHLRSLGCEYGDFPAHDGLWQMARKTAHDPLVRMALVPRVLEARGLDVSPGMIQRLRAAGDVRGAEIIEIILGDEVAHVAIGTRWFRHLCIQRALEPDATFDRLLGEYGAPRPVLPLNAAARQRANFSQRELSRLEAMARSARSSP
jgi:uncharacterized ferritin-like protein (DUF455 family)